MTTDAATLFFALLAVGAELAVVGAVVLAVGGALSPGLARVRHRAAEAVRPQALVLGSLVALVAMTGSLYLSEVANFLPCKLCWYQRYAMYPLVPILGVAAWMRWFRVWLPALVIAVIGGSISIWHILIERDIVRESGACDPTNPCSLIWVKRFGYLTIPTMALSGFALIITLMLVARPAAAD
jgi:disulfide bond formation protein DsbB